MDEGDNWRKPHPALLPGRIDCNPPFRPALEPPAHPTYSRSAYIPLWQPPSHYAKTGICVRDGMKMRRPIIELRLALWLAGAD